jgi:ribonuclease M5
MRMQVKQAVIVEGKYDKIKLSGFLDAIILETDGFQIFKDKAKQKLIRRLAEQRGIIVLTDSDSAGFLIRSFLSGITNPKNITNVYIPDIFGKEKRKDAPSAEGKLGVEGVPTEILLEAGIDCEHAENETPRRLVTKTDLFEDGLSGGTDSAAKRRALLKALDLPEHMSANAMLQLINSFMTYEDYKAVVAELEGNA